VVIEAAQNSSGQCEHHKDHHEGPFGDTSLMSGGASVGDSHEIRLHLFCD